MLNQLFLMTALLFSTTAFSQDEIVVTPNSENVTSAAVQPDSAEALLAADLRAGVKLMNSEARVYNYFVIPELYPHLLTPQGRQQHIDLYFNAVMGRFWDVSYVTDTFINAGPGVYAAIDPLISKAYGNAVLEITIPAGTKYLRLVHTLAISQKTLAALLEEGFVTEASVEVLLKRKGKLGFSRDSLKNMTSDEHVSFRKLIQRIFYKEQIATIEYNWDTDLSTFCKKHSYSAFVLIGKPVSPVNFSQITNTNKNVLTVSNFELKDLTQEELDSAARIQFYQTILEDIKNKKAPAYTDEEVQDLRAKTFSCQF